MGNQNLYIQPTKSDELGVALQLSAAGALSIEARHCFQDGMAKLQAAEPSEAVDFFSRVVELAPNFHEARVCLGLAYALSYKIYPAMDHLELAGQLDPESFAAHYSLAQLNFKLRTPQKGYVAAEKARRCIGTVEQRRMLTELLKEERTRERNGIARPWFNTPFSKTGLYLAGGGLAAAITALLLHVRW
jgi:tetratricopeptide (TPR) repeat protein